MGLKLRNAGKIPIIAPYLRIKGSFWGVANNVSDIVRPRAAAEEMIGFYATRDTLIHVGDEMTLAERSTGLDFRYTGQRDLPSAIALLRKDGSEQNYRMLPFGEMTTPLRDATDRLVEASGVYGAENAPVTPFKLTIDKQSLLDLFCRDAGIAAQLSQQA
ncbi:MULTISPECIES: hypothetical protein [unclassified Bradyrhizobium]|uniref:hypothetical protein n=1 Tax=unclassified Bradyrhizobium TaxID=2631580 RepID=UPI00247A8838|nr:MULTISPECIES: hypothetical protein [unclassified Bradyrhizobium]WGR70652.1 hypothetical protein MTX24_35945 [Bradyrhizobium sp. ISRA426]WGR75490.1 hypothetical protein MTX21_21050 [Bradyrhizobium sp. ISRA430]WGR85893.1 hypothetical protein MTX25_35635 [Bradyrhizobium sp. ISRA432]